MLRMTLVIIKHLMSYLEIFITKKMAINDAEMIQNEFNSIVGALNNYIPKAQKYIEAKNSLLNNVKTFYKGREKLLKDLNKEYFC